CVAENRAFAAAARNSTKNLKKERSLRQLDAERRHRSERQPRDEPRLAWPGLERQLAPVQIADDPARDVETETSTVAGLLCGEERLEHPLLDRLGNSRAVVAYLDAHRAIVAPCPNDDASARAEWLDGVERVVDQMRPGLVQITRI